MGLLGQPAHPQVQKAILDGIAVVRAAGKAPGVLAGMGREGSRYGIEGDIGTQYLCMGGL